MKNTGLLYRSPQKIPARQYSVCSWPGGNGEGFRPGRLQVAPNEKLSSAYPLPEMPGHCTDNNNARQLREPTGNRPCCRQNGNRRVVMKIHKPATIRTDTDLFIPEPANRLTRTFLAISGKRHDSPFLPCPGVSYCSSTCRCFEDVIFNRRAISLRRKTLNVPIDLAIRASPFHISPSQ